MLALALLLAAAEAPPAEAVIAKLTERMIAAERGMNDVTATFHRQEYLGGELQPVEKVLLKWRRSGDLSMKWLDSDRELLWRPGWTRLKLKEGFFTLELAPDSWFVTRETRHTIFQAGLSALVKLIIADDGRGKRHGGVKVALLPSRKIFGAAATCYAADSPKAVHPDFYAVRAEICVGDASGLPLYVKAWDNEDGALRVVGVYSYEDVRLNTGLTDADFSAL